MKEQEAKVFSMNIGFKTPLSKYSILGDVLFLFIVDIKSMK